MTTTNLLRETVEATGGDYALAHEYLRAQRHRYPCVGTAIALLEKRKAEHPASTRFRVDAGGRVVFAESSVPRYAVGDPLPAGIEVVVMRPRGKRPYRAFRVGNVTHLKFARALDAARKEATR